jgi:hypothetical protein
MLWFDKMTAMPAEQEALPGRDDPMPVPDRHFVLDAPLKEPFPAGLKKALFGMGCFWGAERVFWELPGVYTTAVGYAGGYTPNPTYKEVCSGRTGHNEVVLVVFDPARSRLRRAAAGVLGGPTTRPRACARATTSAPSTARASTSSTTPSGRRRGLAARGLSEGPGGAGLWGHHHRDPRRAAVLLRRGIPPAVPRQEPRRLLRPGRHRRLPAGAGNGLSRRARGSGFRPACTGKLASGFRIPWVSRSEARPTGR